jgi:HNH endonuclease
VTADDYSCSKNGRADAPIAARETFRFEIEHVQPKAKGGSNRISNLVLACRPCNEAKGSRVKGSSGGRTKFNRQKLEVPKTHCLDAACTGELIELSNWQMPVVAIKATGRGAYQRTNLDKFGFPRGYLLAAKTVRGFRTGDLVKAHVSTGNKAGVHNGKVAIRASGSFDIQTSAGAIQHISHKHCRLIQRADGYCYSTLPALQ